MNRIGPRSLGIILLAMRVRTSWKQGELVGPITNDYNRFLSQDSMNDQFVLYPYILGEQFVLYLYIRRASLRRATCIQSMLPFPFAFIDGIFLRVAFVKTLPGDMPELYQLILINSVILYSLVVCTEMWRRQNALRDTISKCQ